jgi:hypothetical protein
MPPPFRPLSRQPGESGRCYSRLWAATRASARSGAGQTPSSSASATVTASANADAGDTYAHRSSETGSLMYMATTTRR